MNGGYTSSFYNQVYAPEAAAAAALWQRQGPCPVYYDQQAKDEQHKKFIKLYQQQQQYLTDTLKDTASGRPYDRQYTSDSTVDMYGMAANAVVAPTTEAGGPPLGAGEPPLAAPAALESLAGSLAAAEYRRMRLSHTAILEAFSRSVLQPYL